MKIPFCPICAKMFKHKRKTYGVKMIAIEGEREHYLCWSHLAILASKEIFMEMLMDGE